MTSLHSHAHSEYMEWAKTRSHARFSLATSGVQNFPFARLGARLEDLALSVPGGYGYPPLQQRLAARAGVTPDCVVAATGTSMANHLAMAAVLEPGDDVLIEHPAYSPLLDVASYLGARILRLPRLFEEEFRVNTETVRCSLTPRTRLIVLTNLHNPSNALASDDSLREIGHLARDAGAWVLVDEVYRETLFDPRSRSAFHLGENFLVTSSLTKAYGLSGLRCGWILAPSEIARRIWHLNDLFGVIPAHVAERLSVLALDRLDEIAAWARSILAANRARLEIFLRARGDLEAFLPPAGTVVFPRLLSGSVDDFCRLLREKYEGALVPGRFFEMPAHFRLGMGGEPGMFAEALERLGAALDEFAARRSIAAPGICP
jgi:aspartate/methionine/tyrosine aminotransferase